MYFKLFLIGALAAGFVYAQDEGGGGGGGGRGGGGGGMSVPQAGGGMPSPLDRMANVCKLSKDQKKQFNTILDAASKSAVDLRKQIPGDREQLEKAAQTGASADEIKKLEEATGLATAQMTQVEMKAFVDLYKLLDADQKKSGGQQVFFLVSGMFMKKNWNE